MVRKGYFLALSLDEASEDLVGLMVPPLPGDNLEAEARGSVFGVEELEVLVLEA